MSYEQTVRKIISDVFEEADCLDGYSREKHLMDIGVDSLMFIQIVIAIEEEFEFEFPEEKLSFVETGTVELLCEVIESALEESSKSSTEK